MKNIDLIHNEDIRRIRYLCTDIDDTLTRDGRLYREAFDALWRLYNAGYIVIPVTGRPAGWCDCIVRQWPVHAVVGENGAFAFYLEEGKRQTITHPETADSGIVSGRLERIGERILREVPGCALAKDQPYRTYDLAIDFSEESDADIETAGKIRRIAETYGAAAKISSIHVNIWFGEYDKLSMVRHVLRKLWEESDRSCREKVLYCGDSPNDEPMFSFFPFSVGMSNISPFLPDMENPPAFVTARPFGAGFADVAEAVLRVK